jgi:uncharacterized protein YfaP (DUF2135 family)
MKKTLIKKSYFFAMFMLLSSALFSQQTEIQILSAVVKDEVIPNAQVIFQKNGETSVNATTDSHGKINIPSPFGGIDDPSVTLIVKKEGYSTLVTKGPCNGLTYAISPTMNTLDGLRVVLNWNKNPLDIDSHLAYSGNHIFFSHKTGTMANLDVDDVDGYGPETVTVEKKMEGQKYVYAVHDYTDKEKIGNHNLSILSGAKVFVYIGNTLIKTYLVPKNNTGNLWVVFMIDENGAFSSINKFSDASTPELAGAQLQDYLGNNLPFNEASIPQNDIQESFNLNKEGENAYHAGDLESSVTYYQSAIELDPNNGQAYSNLGLSFQKLNKEAEAIWANRKAIELAHGPNTNTIKASSYYNIAKIYEKKGQWEDALQNYTRAKELKQNAAYDNGIKRMKEKLGRQ